MTNSTRCRSTTRAAGLLPATLAVSAALLIAGCSAGLTGQPSAPAMSVGSNGVSIEASGMSMSLGADGGIIAGPGGTIAVGSDGAMVAGESASVQAGSAESATTPRSVTSTASAASSATSSQLPIGQFISRSCTPQETITVDQDGSSIFLEGPCGVVTISASGTFVTGTHADVVEVTGDENSVTISEVDEVRVSGATNSVFWDAGSSKATDTGVQNTLLGP